MSKHDYVTMMNEVSECEVRMDTMQTIAGILFDIATEETDFKNHVDAALWAGCNRHTIESLTMVLLDGIHRTKEQLAKVQEMQITE